MGHRALEPVQSYWPCQLPSLEVLRWPRLILSVIWRTVVQATEKDKDNFVSSGMSEEQGKRENQALAENVNYGETLSEYDNTF